MGWQTGLRWRTGLERRFSFFLLSTRIFGEPGCGLAGVFGGFGNHFGFYVVEGSVFVVDVGIGIGYALFEEFRLAVEELAHFVDF